MQRLSVLGEASGSLVLIQELLAGYITAQGPIAHDEVTSLYKAVADIIMQMEDYTLSQLPFQGPLDYLYELIDAVQRNGHLLRNVLIALHDAPSKREALLLYVDFVKRRLWILQFFLNELYRPPFSMIADILPIERSSWLRFVGGKRYSYLFKFYDANIKGARIIEWYLTEPVIRMPKNRILRFMVKTCQREKRWLYEKAINKLLTTFDELEARLITHLKHHVNDLENRRRSLEYPS